MYEEAESLAKPSLWQIYWAFLGVGGQAFGGGGQAHLYRVLVRGKGWLSEEEFLRSMALCRVLPGPVFANAAAYLGARLRGPLGGGAALLGVLSPGVLLMLLLSLLYLRLGARPGAWAQGALSGVAAAAIGVFLEVLLHQAPRALSAPKALGLALAVFLAYGLLHLPLLWVLLGALPLGVLLFWEEAR